MNTSVGRRGCSCGGSTDVRAAGALTAFLAQRNRRPTMSRTSPRIYSHYTIRASVNFSSVDKEHAAAWVIQVLRDRPGRPVEQATATGGLRERKKRQTRQLISDTATLLFLERGFDKVRVAEVAAACGVSEKTVFNYFPTKESLVLDQEGDMADQVRRALAPDAGGRSLVDNAVEVIVENVRDLFARLEEDQEDDRVGEQGVDLFRRFIEMIDGTPALRAAQRDLMDRLVQVAAGALAKRADVSPDDPEPQMAATAILGLWTVALRATERHTGRGLPPAQARDAVIAEIRRAGRLIDSGLWCFGAIAQGGAQREQLRLAAQSVDEARRQVIAAIRQARAAWRQVKSETARRH
jgi:AcrR family transcriptional regulator